jgi:hypothetical protein
MAKKKRLSDDAFSWVQNTETANKSKSAKRTPAQPIKSRSAAKSGSKRIILVEYDQNDGAIVATHEILSTSEEVANDPGGGVSEGETTARVALIGELLDKQLIDIHRNYKVVISRKKPKLVPKA